MKTRFLKGLLLGAFLVAGSATAVRADFSVPWFVVAGGGGTATNGSFSMTGTFGQWEASAQPLTNGVFALGNGFWSILELPSLNLGTPNGPLIITNSDIVVAIASPLNNALVKVNSGNSVLVKGTVKGIGANDQLEITVNTNAPVPVSGTTSHGTLTWSYTAPLANGVNLIVAQTFNTNGSNLVVSLPVSRTVFYVTNTLVAADKSTLTLVANPSGAGKFTGQKTDTLLELNKVYTVTAAPVGNTIFTSWVTTNNTNEIISTNAALSFIMTPLLGLQANFIPNPFTAVAGTYNGLFAPDSGPTEANSGMLTVTIASTSRGTFSGKLLLAGGSYSFTGFFDLDGDGQATVTRTTGLDPLQIILHVNLGGTPDDTLTGSVIDFASGGWTSTLLAEAAVFSRTSPATQFTGKYTMVIPPGSNTPDGFGYATLTGSSAGAVTIGGTLADNTTFSQSVAVSKDGSIPLYASLYTKKGSLQGWLSLTNTTTNQPSPVQMVVATNLAWFKPVATKGILAQGFTNTDLTALGSLYVAAGTHANVLNLSNATLTIGGGGLAAPLTFTNITFNGNKLVSANTALSGSVTAASGVLAVSLKADAGVNAAISAKGVVLQDTTGTNGAGFFVPSSTATNSGYFLITQ